MSVLFCDLVGFTAASEQQDPEDVRARIRPYHARLREEIEGYGGTVEKFVGDAVMAVFGAPVAHEDDAERAVRAGLADSGGDRGAERGGSRARAAGAGGDQHGRGGGGARRPPGAGRGDRHRGCREYGCSDPVGCAGRWGCGRGADLSGDGAGCSSTSRCEPVSVKGKAEPLALWRGEGGPLPLRDRHHPPVHDAAGRPRVGEAAVDRDVRAGGAAALGAAGHDRRRAGGGQEQAGRRAVRLPGDEAGADPLAAGALPSVWGGDHVLGVGGDRQGGGGDPRVRLGGGGCGGSWTRRSPRRSRSGSGCCSGSPRWSGWRRPRRRSGRSCSRPGGATWKGWPRPGRPCWCSRICTGRTRRCSRSWSIWPSGRRGCRCSSCARRGRSCTSGTRVGRGGCETRRRSTCRRSRIRRRPSSFPT